MKRALLFLVCAVVCSFVIFGCEWLERGPKPLPQQVVTNQIGIKKEKLSSTEIKDFSTSPFKELLSKKVFGKRVSGYRKVSVSGTDYDVSWDFDTLFFTKSGSPEIIVKKISLPAIIYTFTAFTARFGSNEYVVVCTQNVPIPCVSLLLILDAQLNVVYEEHCPHIGEIELLHHEFYGDCVITKRMGYPRLKSGEEKYYVYRLPKK